MQSSDQPSFHPFAPHVPGISRAKQAVNRFAVTFRDRYTNIVIEQDLHLRHLFAYIHLNPVVAGMCAAPEKYRWSSCRVLHRREDAPGWLSIDLASSLFPEPGSLENFTKALLEGKVAPPADFDFERGVLVSRSERTADPPGKPVDRHRWTPEAVVMAVSRVTGEDLESMRSSGPGRGGNPARAVLVHGLTHHAQLPLLGVVQVVGGTANAVSCLLHRMRRDNRSEERDALLKALAAELEKMK